MYTPFFLKVQLGEPNKNFDFVLMFKTFDWKKSIFTLIKSSCEYKWNQRTHKNFKRSFCTAAFVPLHRTTINKPSFIYETLICLT
jgi:hypothetical protein